MNLEVEAVYEGGVLKLAQPLPLPEHQRVRVTIQVTSRVQQSYGLVRWTGSTEELDRLLKDPDNHPWSGQ
jgi:predicted DNA-binding antitoxin AbrB/MazE fold protein